MAVGRKNPHYSNEELQKRNVHLSTGGYILVFFVKCILAFLVMKFFLFPFGFIAGMCMFAWAFYNIPTLMEMWQHAEKLDDSRKNDRLL